MHPTIHYRLAEARAADLREQARRDALARSARRTGTEHRGRAAGRAAARKALVRAPSDLVA